MDGSAFAELRLNVNRPTDLLDVGLNNIHSNASTTDVRYRR